MWSPNDHTKIRMWIHKESEHVLYEEHPVTIARGLPIMKKEWIDVSP